MGRAGRGGTVNRRRAINAGHVQWFVCIHLVLGRLRLTRRLFSTISAHPAQGCSRVVARREADRETYLLVWVRRKPGEISPAAARGDAAGFFEIFFETCRFRGGDADIVRCDALAPVGRPGAPGVGRREVEGRGQQHVRHVPEPHDVGPERERATTWVPKAVGEGRHNDSTADNDSTAVEISKSTGTLVTRYPTIPPLT